MSADKDNNTAAHRTPERRWAAMVSRTAFWKRLSGWSIVLFAVAVGLAAMAYTYYSGSDSALFYFPAYRDASDRGMAVEEIDEPLAFSEPAHRRALDGSPIDREDDTNGYVAIMIDNIAEARPQAGISEAPLVIEAPVEAGITRLMAIYPEGDLPWRVGPVRSARPYFVDWAEEYDALFVHVGGSDEALGMLEISSIRDLNQFSNGKYFWRDRDRIAPHNTYTSDDLLTTALIERFDAEGSRPLVPWEFKSGTDKAERPDTVADLEIAYGNSAYAVTWEYDRETNTYLRYQGGEMAVDEKGVAVRARNIVVQYTEVRIIDTVGRRAVRTDGSGSALVVRDGSVQEGIWKRWQGRTRFLMENGAEIPLNAGITWIEVVPANTAVSF